MKGRKSNRRAKRSVFIGLPQRVPKLTNDKSKDKQGVEDASEKNIEMKNEPVIKTKESDGVDGVFAFPRDDEPSDAQAQDTPVSEAQCLDVRNIKKEDGISVSKSRISLEKISTKPPHSNTQHLGHDKENIFPPKCDLDISSVVGKISIENKCKSTVYLRNNPNLSSTKVPSTDECAKTKSDICSTAPPDRRTGKPHEPGPELRQRTPLASIGLDIVNKPPQMVSSQLENRVQKCRDEKPSQYTGKTFQSAHFNQKSTLNGNTGAQHGSAIQKNSFTHTAGSDEIKTPHTSCNNNSKSTSLSFTLASNAISNDSSSASSGLSHLSMAGIKHGMHEMSRMTAQNSSAIQNVTVNGKTYNKLNMIGRGGSSEVRKTRTNF